MNYLAGIAALLGWHVGTSWPTPDTPPRIELERRSVVATGKRQTCNGTVWGYPGDRWAGGDALWLPPDGQPGPIRPSHRCIAHRTAPLGSLARVCHQGMCTWARVCTRGPYGCMLRAEEIQEGQTCGGPWKNGKRWCVCAGAYRMPERHYRGCVDMTPAIQQILGHDGYGTVMVETERR